MKTGELMGYSRRILKGRRREMLLICLPTITAGMLFFTAETAIYSLLLYFGAFEPADLFTGKLTGQLIIAGIFAVLRILVMPPLKCAFAVKAREFADPPKQKTSLSELLLSSRFLRRSISSAILSKLVSGIIIAPAIAAGAYVFTLIRSGTDSRGLFTASNFAVFGLVLFILWVKARLSMGAIPFILAEHPDMGSIRAVFRSFSFMSGRRRMPVMLGMVYFLPIITVIAAPFFIPEAAAAYAVGMSIFFREDENESGVSSELGVRSSELVRDN